MKLPYIKAREAAVNQIEIVTPDYFVFQSYGTLICYIDRKLDEVFFDREKWNYSTTTALHLNRFLENHSKPKAADLVKANRVTFADLNS